MIRLTLQPDYRGTGKGYDEVDVDDVVDEVRSYKRDVKLEPSPNPDNMASQRDKNMRFVVYYGTVVVLDFSYCRESVDS